MSDIPLDEAPEAPVAAERPPWTRPLVEIVSMEQTLNSGTTRTDGSTQLLDS